MSEPLNTRPAAESHLVDLTPQGLRRVRAWGVSIALGSFLFGFDTGIISGALLFIREDFDLTSFQQGSVVSILLLGAVIGALTCGNIADRYGRKPVLAALGVVFFLGIGATAFAPGYWTVLLGRVVMGLAVGGVSATVPTYLGEMAPAQVRGRMLSLNQLFITFGLLTSYLVNWALSGAEAWRAMFGVGLVPALLLFLAALWLPESPAWLVRKGRMEQARKVVDRVAEPGDADRFVDRVHDAQREEDRSGSSGGVGDLFRGTALAALLVACVLAALQQFAGINTIFYYAPTIISQAGLSASNAIFYSIFIGTVNVAVTFVSLALIDRVGRRPLLLGSLAGMTVSIALLGLAFAAGMSPLAMLVFMMLFIVAFGVGMGPVFWVLLGEVFPSAQRAEGASAGATVNWLSNFLVSLAFLPLVNAVGQAATFWGFAVLCLLGFAFVAKWVPETRERNADEVGADLRRRWRISEG
ncbi:sugar porter family MFS transporter [Nocardiopsis kunsanensis]|uniref:sugar porter family MFS transporter n=1 Tax=Nocardiopsis kunsanensis TaxID=141693 RepID=UPI000345BBEF|nr:sugar porter family MFS transporter [Nocardiopsis kunsanensis]